MSQERLEAKRAELAQLEQEFRETDARGQVLNQQAAELQKAIPAHNARMNELHTAILKAQGAIEALEQLANDGE